MAQSGSVEAQVIRDEILYEGTSRERDAGIEARRAVKVESPALQRKLS